MTKPKFLMATNGHCFFCLQSPKSKGEEDVTLPPLKVTLQNIFRYLKINLKEVYSEASAVPLSSGCLEVLGRSEVQGTSCSDCAQLSEHFSRYFLELQVIQMKLLSYLKSIHCKMTDAMGGQRLEEFKEEMLSRPDTLLQYKVVGLLRKKTVAKCNRKLTNVPPHVKLERLFNDKTNNNPGPMEDDDNCSLELNNQSSSTSLYTVPENELDDDRSTQGPLEGNIIQDYESYPFLRNPLTGGFKCIQCHKEFKTYWPLKVHFSSVHLKLKFKCSVCSRTFSQKHKLAEHQRIIHFGHTYPCKFCPKSFNSSNRRGQHIRWHCPARPKIKQSNNSKWIVTTPIGSRGEPPKDVIQTEGSPSPSNLRNPITGHYKCSECPMEFISLWQIQNHFRKIHIKQKYKCSKCERSFSDQFLLRRHLKKFHLGRCFACKFCSKPFKLPRNLRLHMDLHCPNKKEHDPNTEFQRERPITSTSEMLTLFECEICYRKFVGSENLLGHKKNVHNCSYCENKYVHKRNKDRHERLCSAKGTGLTPSQEESNSIDDTHLRFNEDLMILPNVVDEELRDEKLISLPDDVPPLHEIYIEEAGSHPPVTSTSEMLTLFECDVCDRKFGSSELLMNHTKNVHNCSYCEKTYIHKASRDRHVRSCSAKGTASTASQEDSHSRDGNPINLDEDLMILPNDGDEEVQDEEGISLAYDVPLPPEMCPEEPRSEPPVTSTSASSMLPLFECGVCDRKFGASALLFSHEKDVHNCRYCENTYVHKRSKDRHERSCPANLKDTTPSEADSHSRDDNPMNVNDYVMVLPYDGDEELRDEDAISLPDDVPPPPEICPEEAQVDPLSQENGEGEEYCPRVLPDNMQFSTKDEPDSESDVEIITDFGPTTNPNKTRTIMCQFCNLGFDSEEEARKHTISTHLTRREKTSENTYTYYI